MECRRRHEEQWAQFLNQLMIQQALELLDQIKNGILGGVEINLHLKYPQEQMWVLDKDNNAEFVPTKAVTGECNGREAGKNSPVDPNFTLEGATGVVHSHTYEVLPFPGPEDGVIPSHYGIPNYGISPNGIWVVNPGPPLSVSLLSGSWGKGPSGERFNPSAYTALINSTGSGGRAARCLWD